MSWPGWQEHAHLGEDETAQIVYGHAPEATQDAVERLREKLRKYPVREAAREAGMTTRTIQKVRNGTTGVRPSTLARIHKAVERLSVVTSVRWLRPQAPTRRGSRPRRPYR